MGLFNNRGLAQDVTYWGPDGRTEYGERGYAPPTLLKGRIEQKNQTVLTPSGDEITSDTVIFLSDDVMPGGQLVEGDYTPQSDPSMVPAAREIQSFVKIPDLRNVSSERKAFL